eukprot:225485_1
MENMVNISNLWCKIIIIIHWKKLLNLYKMKKQKKNAQLSQKFIKTYISSLSIPKEEAITEVNKAFEDLPQSSVGKIMATPAHAMKHALIHHLLIQNGADVNFSCFKGDRSESALAYALQYYFDSFAYFHIMQSLLDHKAKLLHSEIKVLPQLFINASSKNDEEREKYFKLLEDAAKNSQILLKNIIDSDG